MATNAAQFKYVAIPVENRPLRDLNGNLLQISDGQGGIITPGDVTPGPGKCLFHWFDEPLAGAWIAEAFKQLNLAYNAKNTPVPLWNAMVACAQAIANVYNALNLPWQADPQARFLYRKYIAGLPSNAVNVESAEFSTNYDYNDTFSTRNLLRMMTGSTFAGIIPQRAYHVMDLYMVGAGQVRGAHPGQFLQTFTFCQQVPSNVRIAANTYSPNHPKYLPGRIWIPVGAYNPYAETSTCDDELTIESADQLVNFVASIYPNLLSHCRTSLGADCNTSSNPVAGWDTYWFDAEWSVFDPNASERFCGSLQDYWQWFRDWITILKNRTPRQIVLDSRAYVVYYNAKLAALSGGSIQSLLDAVGITTQRLQTPDANITAALNAGATAAAAIGAAIGTVTYGIGAIVGGAIALLLKAGTALVQPDLSQVKLDDLGRAKPFVERGWLGGNPADKTMGGRPGLPVPAPDNWVRGPQAIPDDKLATCPVSQADINAAIQMDLTNAMVSSGTTSLQDNTQNTVLYGIAGLAIFSGLLYAGYRIYENRNAAPATKTPPRKR